MVLETIKKFKRTNIFVLNQELWAWAQYRAKTLDYSSASEYLFDLIALDKEKSILRGKKDKV